MNTLSRKMVALFLLLSLALSALSACAAPTPQVLMERDMAYPASAPMSIMPMEEAAYDSYEGKSANSAGGSPGMGSGTSGLATQVERMVIKNATLTIIVPDPQASAERIGKMAEALGGYVVGANLYQTSLPNGGLAPQGSVTVRVPVETLTQALDQIKSETQQPVRNENISSQDVTGEYTDLESRLRNLEAAETQLQKIMEQATETEDVLNVYSQLVQTREQIEVIKGQMKYYSQSAAMSLIAVELIPDAATQPIQIGGWQPSGVAREAIQDLIYALQDLVDWAIRFVIYTLPLLLILFTPVALVVWGLRRWQRHRIAAKTPPPAPSAKGQDVA